MAYHPHNDRADFARYQTDQNYGDDRSTRRRNFSNRRNEYTDARGASRAWSPGGEYLRDTPAHRDGMPDIEYESANTGDYADQVVGGDYIRGYGQSSDADLFSQNRDFARDDYSRGSYSPGDHSRSPYGRNRFEGEFGNHGRDRDESRRGNYATNATTSLFSSLGTAYGTGSFPGSYRRSSEFGGAYGGQSSSGEYGNGGHRGKGPKGYTRSDERIREDLNERLTDDDSIDPSEIHIDVKNGVVTLQGTVDQRWIKHRVEDLADNCSGVKDVVNQLRVQASTSGNRSTAV